VISVCALLSSAAVGTAPAEAGDGARGGARARASIIAGGTADIAGFPYVVAVFRKGRLHCGASVISPTKVLTAAHCVEGFDPAKLSVISGSARLSDQTVGEVTAVATAVPHPDYVDTQVHDIGVITLVNAISAPPIPLPTPEEGAALGLPGQMMHVAGWGARNPFGFSLSKVLMQTTETIRTDRRCRRAYRMLFSAPAMLCALGRKLKRFGRPFIHTTACSGDSGGPLVADTTTGTVAVGTVSFGGAFCGLGAAPTVYSRVSDSLSFIQSQL
jgi:secreted trypsin-like serine protease